jgi:hypothetical protein
VGPTLYREIAAPVNSKRELERLANQYVRQRKPLMKRRLILLMNPLPRYWWQLLQDPNPQYRYVGVIAAERDWHNTPFIEMLKSERSTIVRRAIAQRLRAKDLDPQTLVELSSDFVPELAYMIEAAARNQEDPPLPNVLPKPLNVLAAYYGTVSWSSYRSLAVELAASESVRGSIGYGQLSGLFRSGLDRGDLSSLPDIPETEVRSSLRELSPFDEGGLGTFDELKAINQIDQFYLFFRQLLFFIERDLLTS